MAEKQKKGHFAPIRFLILTAACAMFLYSGYQLFVHWYEDRQSQKGQQDLIDQAVVVIKSTEGESEPAEETEQSDVSKATEPKKVLADAPPIFVDFETLLSENPNIVAWIYSEGTVINYPVVQGDDNDEYLHKGLNGKYLRSGTLFVEAHNQRIGMDPNYIIYGHSMKNGSMFGMLLHYKKQSYYADHPVMYYLTPEGDYRIELFAGKVVKTTDPIYSVKDGSAEFYEHVQTLREKSTFQSDVTISEQDTIVTLSTCSYEFDQARYVLLGKLVPIE